MSDSTDRLMATQSLHATLDTLSDKVGSIALRKVIGNAAGIPPENKRATASFTDQLIGEQRHKYRAPKEFNELLWAMENNLNLNPAEILFNDLIERATEYKKDPKAFKLKNATSASFSL